jgi:hypothetical protein
MSDKPTGKHEYLITRALNGIIVQQEGTDKTWVFKDRIDLNEFLKRGWPAEGPIRILTVPGDFSPLRALQEIEATCQTVIQNKLKHASEDKVQLAASILTILMYDREGFGEETQAQDNRPC